MLPLFVATVALAKTADTTQFDHVRLADVMALYRKAMPSAGFAIDWKSCHQIAYDLDVTSVNCRSSMVPQRRLEERVLASVELRRIGAGVVEATLQVDCPQCLFRGPIERDVWLRVARAVDARRSDLPVYDALTTVAAALADQHSCQFAVGQVAESPDPAVGALLADAQHTIATGCENELITAVEDSSDGLELISDVIVGRYAESTPQRKAELARMVQRMTARTNALETLLRREAQRIADSLLVQGIEAVLRGNWRNQAELDSGPALTIKFQSGNFYEIWSRDPKANRRVQSGSWYVDTSISPPDTGLDLFEAATDSAPPPPPAHWLLAFHEDDTFSIRRSAGGPQERFVRSPE